MLAHGGVGNATVAVGVGTAVVPLRNHQVFAHADVLVEVVRGVHASRDALVERVGHQTVLVDVVGREQVAALLRSVRDAGREVLRPGSIVDFLLPVGVGCCHAVHRAHQLRLAARAVERGSTHGSDAVVGASLPVGLSPLCSREHVVAAGYCLQGGVVVQVDGHLAVLTLLRGDDDHAVGGTRTIDTGRRGILQHLNRLDVGRVQRVQVLRRGHTVDDVERVAGVHRTHTAHADGRTATARGSIGHDVDTGQLALHGVQHVRIALRDGTFHVHHRHGTCQVGLALYLITRDDHLGEFLGVVAHGDVHACLCGQFLRLESDVGDDERGALGSLQVEVAVEVGDGAVRGAFLHDCSADDGFACVVDDGAAGFGLCKSKGACQKEEERQHQPACQALS